MIVIVAEKPSVGRDIARVLGCRQNGEGCIAGEKYTVTWAVGHLVTLCEPDEIDEKYKKWRMADLPILPEDIPTKVISKTKKQFSVIKKLINDKDTERVICATDAGREGELIFHYIYDQAKCKKPVDRLWISSMTDEAIREGFEQIKPDSEYEGLRKSAVCRSEADWLVGMNASRAFTLRYNALLSVGRVQTPTLNILVKRRKEIEDFKPVEYFTLTANFGDYTGQWFDEKAPEEKTANRIPTKEKAEALAAKVKGKPAQVRSMTSEEKKELPPQLYDLTSLQRDANSTLGFTADKTLKIAQALYEKWKLLTYPRTDSRYLPMDMIPKLYQTLKALPEPYSSLEAGMERKEDGKLYISRRIFDNSKVSDHHALLPTPKTADLSKLPPDERSLYDMVVRRMLAAFYPAHVYDALKVITDCEGEAFRSTGRSVKVLGWKALYQKEQEGKKPRGRKKAEDETEAVALPPLSTGDMRRVEKADVQQSATKPPAPHTDASLLAAMEHAGREIEDEALRESMKGAGLGTPATRAAIIERLLQVGYAQRRGRAISATDKGVQLIAVAPEEIASPEMTGKWELALDEIAKSQRDTDRFMQGIRRMSAFLVEYARDSAPGIEFPEEMRRGKGGKRASAVKAIEGAVCPLCGKPVQENAKAFGCSNWKAGCHFTLWKDGLARSGGPQLSARIIQLLLKDGQVKGSTGVLKMADGFLTFTPNGADSPSARMAITYEKK
ncbi:MAG: DNA topoisomerase III [Clostridia bacterium]|nr:DNA topoisomerase III [Clostridia bacterium]